MLWVCLVVVVMDGLDGWMYGVCMFVCLEIFVDGGVVKAQHRFLMDGVGCFGYALGFLVPGGGYISGSYDSWCRLHKYPYGGMQGYICNCFSGQEFARNTANLEVGLNGICFDRDRICSLL